MSDVREHDEARWQAQALRPEAADEPAAVRGYRRLYSGIRWAPLPALDPAFAARVLARAGIAEAPDPLERRVLPMLYAALGLGGGLTAGPAVLGTLSNVVFDLAGLPWLQAGAALAALGCAALLDRVLGRRRAA